VFAVEKSIEIRGDPVDVRVRLFSSDPRASVRRYTSLLRLLRSLRIREPIKCRRCRVEEEAWYIIWRGRRFIVLPDHVHVRGADPSVAEALVTDLERRVAGGA